MRNLICSVLLLLVVGGASGSFAQPALTASVLTTPTPGSTLTGSTTTFTWSAGAGVTAYMLYVGTTAGSNNLYDSGSVGTTSATVTGLPTNAATIYATLYSAMAGGWKPAYYTYTEAGTPTPAVLTAPTPSSALTGSTATFTWSAGVGVTAYMLYLGTTAGAKNLYDSGSVNTTSATVTGLPMAGATLYATLYSAMAGGGGWKAADYTYTEGETPTPAVLTTPTPSSTLLGSNVTFEWTKGIDVGAYMLYLGTTAGSNNLYDSGSVGTTSVAVTGLPTNSATIHATLFSEMAGVEGWKPSYYTYTEAATPAPAVLTTPTPSSTLSGSSATFEWTKGTGVTAYMLYLGTTEGENNLYDSGSVGTTSATVTGLPTAGATIYATLYSAMPTGGWKPAYYTFTESGVPTQAVLTTPTPSSTLLGSNVTFEWTKGIDVTAYMLYLGTKAGSNNLYDSGSVTKTSVAVTGLPTNGATIHATLYSAMAGVAGWKPSYYTYTESEPPTPAVLTTPTPSSTLSGSSVTFEWTKGVDVAAYMLYLGTTAGANNLYDSGSVGTTSATVTGLPTAGATIHATLYSVLAGVEGWKPAYYTYTETAIPAPAVLTTPTPSSTLLGSNVTFEWTKGIEVTAYMLYLGTTAGSNNLYDSGPVGTTSVAVTGLPTNSATVYATLYSAMTGGGGWKPSYYTYTESATPTAAVLTTPTPSSTLSGSIVTFEWTKGVDVLAYMLYVGTTAGSNNLYDSGSVGTTSATVTGLPTTGATIHATLYSVLAGGEGWKPAYYTYTESEPPTPAVLTTPTPGSTLTSSTVTFNWTPGIGVSQYVLYLGTTFAGNNLYNSGQTTATSVTVSGLPVDALPMYARLYSLIGNTWSATDYTYTTPVNPLASWFSGGIAGKKIVYWGNSTVSNVFGLFTNLGANAVPGGALEGVEFRTDMLGVQSDGCGNITVTLSGPPNYKVGQWVSVWYENSTYFSEFWALPSVPVSAVNGNTFSYVYTGTPLPPQTSFTSTGGYVTGSILNFGNNGATLACMLTGCGPYPIQTVCAERPDLLIVRGPLINDVRLGATDLGLATSMEQQALQTLRTCSPNTAILLTTENSLLSTDTGQNWVVPNADAQQYTDIMHDAVTAMNEQFPNVEVVDIMSLVYGTTVQASSPLMTNQLHEDDAGAKLEIQAIIPVIGINQEN
jgi:hypothetical protein